MAEPLHDPNGLPEDLPVPQEHRAAKHLAGMTPPFAILSDAAVLLTRALRLPTFSVDGMTLIKRMAWVIDGGVFTKVFYPVFPRDQSAGEVVAWLQASR